MRVTKRSGEREPVDATKSSAPLRAPARACDRADRNDRCYECIEPQISNLFKRETLSSDFLQINRYLVEELKQLGLWTDEIRTAIKLADGSVQGIEELPEELRVIYRTAWELPMRALIDLAADRGAFIDQSQSLNLFMANPKRCGKCRPCR
jgi:ribonucleotide reductase alpha subunit